MEQIFVIQVFIESVAFILSFILIKDLLKKFKAGRTVLKLVLFPLVIFVIGFTLRLTGDKGSIDTGFFLTDYGFLFTYMLTAFSLMLGQIKYWRIKTKTSKRNY